MKKIILIIFMVSCFAVTPELFAQVKSTKTVVEPKILSNTTGSRVLTSSSEPVADPQKATPEPEVKEVEKLPPPILAKVEHVNIIYTKDILTPIKVEAQGNFLDSCTKIDNTSQRIEDRTVYVTMTASNQPELICSQGIRPFKEIIPLSLSGLKAGAYTVNVNGEEESFSIDKDIGSIR